MPFEPPYHLPDVRQTNRYHAGLRLGPLNQVVTGGVIISEDFVTGVAGWRIGGDGSAEFNDVVVRGTVESSAIHIGGDDTTSFHVDLGGNMWVGAGNAAFATAPFRVAADGDVTVSGTGVIKSDNYVAATTGWAITGAGDAEFNDVTVRGTVITTDLEARGNALTVDDAGFEGTTATDQRWEALTGSTVTYDTVFKLSGAQALKLAETAAAEDGARQKAGSEMAVTPGKAYTARVWWGADAGFGGTGYVRIVWLDAGGATLSTATSRGVAVDGGTGWRQTAAWAAIAPANATHMRVELIAATPDAIWADDATAEQVPVIEGGLIVGGEVATAQIGSQRVVLRDHPGGGPRVEWQLPAYYADYPGYIGLGGEGNVALEMVAPRTSGSVTDTAMVVLTDSGNVELAAASALGGVVLITDGPMVFAAGKLLKLAGTGGSATAPSLTFSGDEDTGIYLRAADELAFATAGARRLTIQAGGTVIAHNNLQGNRVFIPGMPTGAGTPVVWNSSFGEIVRDSSSLRYKQAVRKPVAGDERRFAALQVCSYELAAGSVGDSRGRYFGFLAEQVAQVAPLAAVPDEHGAPDAIDVRALVAYVVLGLQDLDRRVAALESP